MVCRSSPTVCTHPHGSDLSAGRRQEHESFPSHIFSPHPEEPRGCAASRRMARALVADPSRRRLRRLLRMRAALGRRHLPADDQLTSRGRGCPTALRFRVGDGQAQRGTAIQPYRCVANSRRLFRKTMAAAFLLQPARRRIIAAKKNLSGRKKKRASVLPAVRLNEITCR
jgi:hypothetical protein